MKKYTIDISFDPPPDPKLVPAKWNSPEHDHDYVHMTIESSSKRCVEWLRDVLLTAGDKDIQNAIVLSYPTKEIEGEENRD